MTTHEMVRPGPSATDMAGLRSFLDGRRRWHLAVGDCRSVLPHLPAHCAQCIVTSPPYWGLRQRGDPHELGAEATPDLYVDNLVAAFRLLRRLLRPDGTAWVVLGSCYLTRPFRPWGLKKTATSNPPKEAARNSGRWGRR